MKVFDVQQRGESWYNLRKAIPTCSRFDSIITAARGEPSKAQESLIDHLLAEALLPPEQGVIKNVMTPEMEEGMRLEGEARCLFDLQYAKEPVHETGFILADNGRWGGSPDGLVGEHSGVEIKCVSGPVQIKTLREGILPLQYRAQVSGYMVVTGRRSWSYFSYCRNLPAFHLTVDWDEFTDKLLTELHKFSEKYNEARLKFGLKPIGQDGPQTP